MRQLIAPQSSPTAEEALFKCRYGLAQRIKLQADIASLTASRNAMKLGEVFAAGS